MLAWFQYLYRRANREFGLAIISMMSANLQSLATVGRRAWASTTFP